MKLSIKYYIEYLYNIFLDIFNLCPNDIININNDAKFKIDLVDLKIISDIEKLKYERWNNFYKKHGR